MKDSMLASDSYPSGAMRPGLMIQELGLASFVEYAYRHSLFFSQMGEWMTVAPPDKIDGVMLASLDWGTEHDVLYALSGGGILRCLRVGTNATCTVAATSEARCEAILALAREWLPESEVEGDEVECQFWFNTPQGPRSYERRLDVPDWEGIDGNYAADAGALLASLMDYRPDERAGKLILWRGAAGTGKTFALRALARAWSPWCDLHYVLDPEELLDHGGYLYRVALGVDDTKSPWSHDDADGQPRWRMVVLEDTGEILAKDAKERSGQRLSRLLNVSDGLLGQGARVLFLITTNEEIGSLHEAVRRPGRCLSEIEFKPFSREEAARWLDARDHLDVLKSTGQSSYTLAELYALAEGRAKGADQSQRMGSFGGRL